MSFYVLIVKSIIGMIYSNIEWIFIYCEEFIGLTLNDKINTKIDIYINRNFN